MDQRRRFLLQGLATGALTGGLGWSPVAVARFFGGVPRQLPEGQSIFRVRGTVWVNGSPADRNTRIDPDDHVRTEADSELVAVVGEDAFMLREESELQLSLGDRARQGLRLLTGALLGVFAPREQEGPEVSTPIAAVGIRGTGIYTESGPERSYVCNCYGHVDIAAADDPAHRETIVSQHHDEPRWVLAEPQNGRRILPAPFINHTDMELIILESLVGRSVPFGAPGRPYRRRRRGY